MSIVGTLCISIFFTYNARKLLIDAAYGCDMNFLVNEEKIMTRLVHFTTLARAVNIMKEGFYPRTDALEFERGANFHSVDNVIEANHTSNECKLYFNWIGGDPVCPTEHLEPNLLYYYEKWRYFIKDCNNNCLVFTGYEIRDDAYPEYNIKKYEMIRYFLSRERACNAYFNKKIGSGLSVKSFVS